jgi:hypothetical protein
MYGILLLWSKAKAYPSSKKEIEIYMGPGTFYRFITGGVTIPRPGCLFFHVLVWFGLRRGKWIKLLTSKPLASGKGYCCGGG